MEVKHQNSKKSGGGPFSIFLAVLIFAAIAAAFGYRYYNTGAKTAAQMFNPEKAVAATKLYNKIMETDLENHYPESPEGVLDFYNDTFYIMYANMIVDGGALWDMMMRQRDVYGEELLMTDPDTQYANLEDSLSALNNLSSVCLGVERKGTIYDQKDPTMCKIQTIIYYNTFGTMYRNYYMKQDDEGRWRVYTWEQADSNFQAVN